MKTTRIVSALLSAILALSSLPLMASNGADSGTQAANVLDGVKPTVENGSVKEEPDTGHTGDYYLRVSGRTSRFDDITYIIESAPATGTYYVSFDARMTTDGIGVDQHIADRDHYKYLVLRVTNTYIDGKTKLQKNYWIPTNNCSAEVTKSGYTTTNLTSSSTFVRLEPKWMHYEFEYLNVAEGDKLAFCMWGSTSFRYAQDFDIDNFKVWYKDSNGTHPINGENGYTFEADNSEEDKFFNTDSTSKAKGVRTKAEAFQRAELASGKDMTLVYTFGENGAGIELDSGVYQLGGDIRCGAFVADLLSDIDGIDYSANDQLRDGATKWSGTIGGITYTNVNDRFVYDSAFDVTVTAYVGDKDYTLISGRYTDTKWQNISDTEFLPISEGEILKKIEIKVVNKSSNVIDKDNYVTNPNLPLDFKNMSLTKKSDDTAELGKSEDNLLSGVTVSSAGDITVDGSYLYVPERAESKADFVTFTVDDKVLAKTYYVSFDVRVSADSKRDTTQVRLQLPDSDKIQLKETLPNGWPASGKTDIGMNAQFVVPLLGENFTVNSRWEVAGDGRYYPVFIIDKEWAHFEGQFTPTQAAKKNLRITINKGAGTYVEPIDVANFKVWTDTGMVYSNDFSDGVDDTVNSNCVVPSVVPTTTNIAAIAGMNTEAKYDVSNVNTKRGIYTFRANVKTGDGTAKAVVEFALSNGDVVTSDSFALVADKYTVVNASCEIESGVSITAITIKADASATLKINGAGLTYRELDDDNSIPNIGIIMVLLRKKQGGAKEEINTVAQGNLIANGDFTAAPEIVKEGLDVAKTAWFANAGEDYHYDANGAAIKDQPMYYHDHSVTWNEDGYVTVTGREFNIRKIYFNTGLTLEPGDYKLSVDCKTANKGENSSIRIAADKLFNATVEDAFIISNSWVTKTIEFTVTEAAPLTLNFYGGPSTDYVQDFCVDNIVLIKK